MGKQTVISSEYYLTDNDTGDLITTYSIHIYENKYHLYDGNGNVIKEMDNVYPQYKLESTIVDYAKEHNCNILRSRVKTQKSDSVYNFELNAFITQNDEYLITWK